ncbi:MAG: DUF1092 family protein [Hormoscilla sp. GM7CHS1pb]|nr:DUF1092 family protein [Hormoscilla sp. GM7CHS1pb]
MGIIWELDFYSCPILDDKNKKIWEVILCESPLNIHRESLFQYSQYCSSKEVNSVKLRQVLEEAIAQAGKAPSQIRFFRRQMKNMITKACQELDIQAVPSRRTIALNQLLEERSKEVYPRRLDTTPRLYHQLASRSTHPVVSLPRTTWVGVSGREAINPQYLNGYQTP